MHNTIEIKNAIIENNLEFIKDVFSTKLITYHNSFVISFAIQNNNIDVLEYFYSKNPEIFQTKHQSFMKIAIIKNFENCVSFLLSKNPDEPLRKRIIHRAINNDNLSIIKMLTRKIIKPDLSNFEYALFLDRGKILNFLLQFEDIKSSITEDQLKEANKTIQQSTIDNIHDF